jgi:hypothetical protein
VFEIDAITRAYFPGCEHGRVNSGALVVLLNDTFQDLGGRLAGGGSSVIMTQLLVYLGNGDARLVAYTQNPANPLQLIESHANLEIHKQVWPKAPRVRLGLGSFNSLFAYEGDVSGIERAASHGKALRYSACTNAKR